MSAAYKIRREEQERAEALAPRNPNACITCVQAMYDAVADDKYSRIPVCQHLKEEHRNRQSKQGLIQNGSIVEDDAELVLRCNFCYKKGRDCFQVSYSTLSLGELD